MTISILINGAFGKMGQETVKAVEASQAFKLVGKLGKSDVLKTALIDKKPEIVIDFTTPEVVYQNTLTIIEHGAHPIIGTTGLSDEQREKLGNLCKERQLGGIIAPNFSLATLLMIKYVKDCARYFSDVEIIELHHKRKKDAPSGTAIKTAESIAQGRRKEGYASFSKEMISGTRGTKKDNIPIHSVRLPGLLAHEMVIFGGEGETLTFRQDTLSRKAFMPGVLLACRKVLGLKTLIYGLEHIL
jgi:4-hydroxy-tetrahydrodipicolinate reductase